ncbi:MAG: hypothetical protein M3380_13675, partial [Chloroflexota bacterium]|nr:hypothetical protein [Chloroflexota bacterium]
MRDGPPGPLKGESAWPCSTVLLSLVQKDATHLFMIAWNVPSGWYPLRVSRQSCQMPRAVRLAELAEEALEV